MTITVVMVLEIPTLHLKMSRSPAYLYLSFFRFLPSNTPSLLLNKISFQGAKTGF